MRLKTTAQYIYEQIKHGDDEHRAWLKEALIELFSGRPAPPPRGDKRPEPMLLRCPCCGERHIDEGEFATKSHHTHACQHCGEVWRPALVPTVGVRFLPGFKNQ